MQSTNNQAGKSRARLFARRSIASAGAALMVASMGAVMPALASAATADSSWIKAPTAAKEIKATDEGLKSYGVRAGSAGGDYLGIANTNFDFTPGGASQTTQYTGYTKNETAASKARIALFGSDANENPNPYLYNLLYNVSGVESTTDTKGGTLTYTTGFTPSTTAATTWMNNPNSWGDTAGAASTNVFTGAATIQGAEFGNPDIVYGATRDSCWGNFDPSTTNWYKQLGANAQYVHNDSSNIWSQIYTMGQLASKADSMTGTTRYGKAVDSAVAYEKAIKGNMLYVASQIDGKKAAKKKVAYLYAIDADAGIAYFFTPKAEGLTEAHNTGMSSTTVSTVTVKPSSDYAANNATVSLGLMDVIPFITDTYDSGAKVSHAILNTDQTEAKDASGNAIAADGIEMAVENICTMSPSCQLAYTASGASNALADVDVIIYNTSTALNGNGTSGGKNLSGIKNTGAYASGMTTASVTSWAKALGFKGDLVIGGDDYGTSSNQPVPGTADAVEGGAAPMLYCQRNYTADRDSRAAWAIAQVYPELYKNADATYGYWVKNIYHIKDAYVDQVVQFMENDSTSSTYDNAAVEKNIATGYNWWKDTGSKSSTWSKFAYYNGSTRASFYDGKAASEEPKDTIGIFAPSALWTAQAPAATTTKKANTLKVSPTKKTVKYKSVKKKAQKVTVKASKAKGSVSYSITKKASSKITLSKKSGSKTVVTLKKGAKKGKYVVTVKAKGNSTYKSKSVKVTITVK